MSAQSPILVVGAGSWGTAIALALARNGTPVWLWGRDAQQIMAMQAQRCNPKFLPETHFPASLHPTDELNAALASVQDVIIAVPSRGFREIVQKMTPHLSAQARICWATKGLEYKTGKLLHEVVAEELGNDRLMAALSGPSFAAEVARGLPTAVTLASTTEHYAQDLVALFHQPRFRLYTSSDLIGVQVGGAIKNVIAMATGFADGLGLGANSRAALITRGLTEMVRFGLALGGQRETFMGLAGMGDLVLTCTDDQSRNRRFGYALAKGHSRASALAEIGQVVEGLHAAREVNFVAQQRGIEMPIVAHVCKVLEDECTLKEAVESLLAREPKPEGV